MFLNLEKNYNDKIKGLQDENYSMKDELRGIRFQWTAEVTALKNKAEEKEDYLTT